MRPILFTMLAVFLAVPSTSLAQEAEKKKDGGIVMGLGLATDYGPTLSNSNSFVARLGVTPEIVVNGSLGVSLQNGDFGEGSGFGLGGSAQYRVFKHEGLFFHVLGGFSYNASSTEEQDVDTQPNPNGQGTITITTDTTFTQSWINLYGGFGAEYFLPNTRRFSLQLDVGPVLRLLNLETKVTSNNTTVTSDADAWRIELADVVSGGLLFTYYFADVQ